MCFAQTMTEELYFAIAFIATQTIVCSSKLTIYCNFVKRLTKHVMLSGYCIQGKLRDFSWLNCKLIHTQTLSPKTNRNSQLQYIPLGNNQRASNNIRLTYPLQITHMGLQITIIFKIKSTERIHNVSKNIYKKKHGSGPLPSYNKRLTLFFSFQG